MISINLIHDQSYRYALSVNVEDQVLCKVCSETRVQSGVPTSKTSVFRTLCQVYGNDQPAQTIVPWPMPPELREALMGKSPLRFVLSRRAVTESIIPNHPEVQTTYWIEKLECGHEVPAYCYVLPSIEPIATRRRCQECKALANSLPSKKPVRSEKSERKEGAA